MPAHVAVVVTIGNFDGVHLGHRALVHTARERADASGADAVAMFFDPHPAAFFRPETAPLLLTTTARRAELLRDAGVDRVDVRTFDEAFSSLDAGAFADLLAELETVAVVVGPDFHFGSGRSGNVTSLRELGEARGFEVLVEEPVTFEGELVSSTRTRRCLEWGDVTSAARLLTRPHDVDGRVVKGDQRGRTIGFPTANLDCDPVLLPADGVYAVRAAIDGRVVGGVANLGVRPTFEAGRSVEVHFLDFEGDLYERTLRVAFVARVRPEKRFDGADALVAQIREDVEEARSILEDA